MNDWIGFCGSIIGGFIGGICTYLGVKLTIKNENKRARKEETKAAIEKRPRLEIVDFKDISNANDGLFQNADCNVLVLNIEEYKVVNNRIEVGYDERALDINQLVYCEYEFKNTGFTEIENVIITSANARRLSVVSLDRTESFLSSRFLNYDVWADKRFIKPGQTLKIRFYYVKDKASKSTLPPVIIWLRDINGRFWTQTIIESKTDIENSELSNGQTFRSMIDVNLAEDCFIDPRQW